MVELIQTTEYLEDVPTWGQRDYWLYLPRYGDPFYKGRGRGRGRGRSRYEWLHERQMDRPNGGFGRGFSHGNGIEVQQLPTGRTQPDRQEEDWSIPTNVEKRENNTERHETPWAPPSNAPPPTEDRLFTDWSSIDSPREKTAQHNVSARCVEANITQINNQADQPRLESARNEAMGNTLHDVTTVPSTWQQPGQVGTRLMDRETNMSEVDLELKAKKPE